MDQRAEEIRKIKEAEAEALSIALYDILVIHFYPCLVINLTVTYSGVSDHPRRNHPQVHKARVQMLSQSPH